MERKIGEIIHGRLVRKVKGSCCLSCCFYSKGMCELTMEEAEARNCGMGMIYVQIKQNKKDMEEKAIKIKTEDIKVGNKVICLSNSKPYVITEVNCRMKYNGEWNDCVIYTPLYDNPYKCFVRPIKDFAQNFMLDNEKEEKHSNLESTGKNLKLFDLEAAKTGKPVCTRDGRKARIICFDQKDIAPIVGLVTGLDGKESIYAFYKDGRVSSQEERADDLMMLKEKKEGWVNVYKGSVCISVYPRIYKSREEAVSDNTTVNRIDTVKIYWEE